MINATFFEISNENTFSNNKERELGSLFLKYRIAKAKIMMLEMITADGHSHSDEIKIFIIVCAGADIPLPDGV